MGGMAMLVADKIAEQPPYLLTLTESGLLAFIQRHAMTVTEVHSRNERGEFRHGVILTMAHLALSESCWAGRGYVSRRQALLEAAKAVAELRYVDGRAAWD